MIVIFVTSQKGELIILNTEEIKHWYNNRSNMWWSCDKDYTIETVMTDCGVSTQDEINNALILRKLNNELYQEWLYQKWILSELENYGPHDEYDKDHIDKVLLEIKRTFKQKNMIKIVKDVNLGLIINEH